MLEATHIDNEFRDVSQTNLKYLHNKIKKTTERTL